MPSILPTIHKGGGGEMCGKPLRVSTTNQWPYSTIPWDFHQFWALSFQLKFVFAHKSLFCDSSTFFRLKLKTQWVTLFVDSLDNKRLKCTPIQCSADLSYHWWNDKVGRYSSDRLFIFENGSKMWTHTNPPKNKGTTLADRMSCKLFPVFACVFPFECILRIFVESHCYLNRKGLYREKGKIKKFLKGIPKKQHNSFSE